MTCEGLHPNSFAFFKIMSDPSLTVMLYWFANFAPSNPCDGFLEYNNNVIESRENMIGIGET
jgi:hypothetical protein